MIGCPEALITCSGLGIRPKPAIVVFLPILADMDNGR